MKQAVEGHDQLNLLKNRTLIVHYFDQNGALHSGRLVKKIEKGKQKGTVIVADRQGHQFIPERIRNIE